MEKDDDQTKAELNKTKRNEIEIKMERNSRKIKAIE